MLNSIPLLGWLLDLGFKASLAVPFYIIYTGFGIGNKYFGFLPSIYRDPSFFNCIGVFIVVPIIYGIFIPKLVSVSQINNTK